MNTLCPQRISEPPVRRLFRIARMEFATPSETDRAESGECKNQNNPLNRQTKPTTPLESVTLCKKYMKTNPNEPIKIPLSC